MEIEHVFGTNLALVTPVCFVWSTAASRDRSLMILYEVRTSCVIKRLSLTFDSLRWRYLKKTATTLFKTIFISNGKR